MKKLDWIIAVTISCTLWVLARQVFEKVGLKIFEEDNWTYWWHLSLCSLSLCCVPYLIAWWRRIPLADIALLGLAIVLPSMVLDITLLYFFQDTFTTLSPATAGKVGAFLLSGHLCVLLSTTLDSRRQSRPNQLL